MPRRTSRRATNQANRFGDEVKLARIGHGMSVRTASNRAGVSWATWTEIERGSPNTTLATLCAVGDAIGLDLVLNAYPGTAPSLRDTGQLGQVRRLLAETHASWQPAVEMAVGQHGRSIDLVLFGPSEILVIEVERLALDYQAQCRRADEKRQLLAAQHRRPVRLVLLIEDTRRNRVALAPHMAVIGRALPAGSRQVLAAIRTGQPLGRDGLLWRRASPLRRRTGSAAVARAAQSG